MILQPTSQETWSQKYQLKDMHGNAVDKDIDGMFERVASALAINERDREHWKNEFLWALRAGCTPAGRILSNAGAGEYKPSTSLINCTVSSSVRDSMRGIMEACTDSAMTLKAGCGIGYEFSTLRPKGALVTGAGAYTSGPLSFMDIFDKMCFTVSSAGGRRGAQMATFAVWHPDVVDFIKAKREDGRLRQFNMSLLIDDEFIEAVKCDGTFDLVFPTNKVEVESFGYPTAWKKLFWDADYCEEMGYILNEDRTEVLVRVYSTIQAVELWNTIMQSTYDFAEPGFLLIDAINNNNNNYFCENIRATNPCVTGDTSVDTDKGSITIKDLIADGIENFKAKSVDVDTGETSYQAITFGDMTRSKANVIELELENGRVVRVTPDHKVFTKNRGYVEAAKLNTDDELVISG